MRTRKRYVGFLGTKSLSQRTWGGGGLGIRDIQLFNTALLAKQAWHIITIPNKLLSRVLTGKYCQKASFLRVSLLCACSHGWRGILAGRDLLCEKLEAVIGDGEDTRVWKDRWLSTDMARAPVGPAPEAFQDLRVADLLTRDSKEWKIQLIEQILPHHLAEIKLLKPSKTGGNDGVVWLGARSGIYSTRSGYFAAAKLENQRHTPQSRINWKALLWTGRVSPKLQVFLWKITQGALPVGANSQLRGMLHNTSCPCCDMLETVLHLFLHCDYAKKVWASSLFSLHFDPDNFTDITAFSDALKHCKSSVCLPPLRILSDIYSHGSAGAYGQLETN